jgi:hypothetical protein
MPRAPPLISATLPASLMRCLLVARGVSVAPEAGFTR